MQGLPYLTPRILGSPYLYDFFHLFPSSESLHLAHETHWIICFFSSTMQAMLVFVYILSLCFYIICQHDIRITYGCNWLFYFHGNVLYFQLSTARCKRYLDFRRFYFHKVHLPSSPPLISPCLVPIFMFLLCSKVRNRRVKRVKCTFNRACTFSLKMFPIFMQCKKAHFHENTGSQICYTNSYKMRYQKTHINVL